MENKKSISETATQDFMADKDKSNNLMTELWSIINKYDNPSSGST